MTESEFEEFRKSCEYKYRIGPTAIWCSNPKSSQAVCALSNCPFKEKSANEKED